MPQENANILCQLITPRNLEKVPARRFDLTPGAHLTAPQVSVRLTSDVKVCPSEPNHFPAEQLVNVVPLLVLTAPGIIAAGVLVGPPLAVAAYPDSEKRELLRKALAEAEFPRHLEQSVRRRFLHDARQESAGEFRLEALILG